MGFKRLEFLALQFSTQDAFTQSFEQSNQGQGIVETFWYNVFFFHSGYWVLQNVYVCLRWRHSASEDEANADSQTLDDVTVPLITEPLTAGPKIVLQWALSVYEHTAEF